MILFLDAETTGLDPELYDIIQIAGILPDESSFNHYMRPRNVSDLDYAAMAVNKIPIGDLTSFDPPEYIIPDIVDLLNPKVILAGWNIYFDYQFLRHAFKKLKRQDFDEIFSYKLLDIQSCVHLATGKPMGLAEACHHFKLPVISNHSADIDIQATYEIYKILGASINA